MQVGRFCNRAVIVGHGRFSFDAAFAGMLFPDEEMSPRFYLLASAKKFPRMDSVVVQPNFDLVIFGQNL